jgi:transcription antitermination protein NusB
MGSRRNAREIALQVLYQLDVQDAALSDEQGLALFWKHFAEVEHDASDRVFADELVHGVRSHLAEIDAAITSASKNWRLERMARVDRNLLRLAVYEIKFSRDVPAKVAINEAIEIAKRYGTAESPAFVNGILDRCLEEAGTK